MEMALHLCLRRHSRKLSRSRPLDLSAAAAMIDNRIKLRAREGKIREGKESATNEKGRVTRTSGN